MKNSQASERAVDIAVRILLVAFLVLVIDAAFFGGQIVRYIPDLNGGCGAVGGCTYFTR